MTQHGTASRAHGFIEAVRPLGDALRRQVLIDRTQLQPVMGHISLVRVLAWVAIAGIFAWGWGRGTILAIEILFGATITPPTFGSGSIEHQISSLVEDAALVAVAVLVIILFRRLPAPPSQFPRVRPSTWWKTFLVAPAAVMLGFTLASVQTTFGGPTIAYPNATTHGTMSTLLYGLSGAMAGPMEELALLAMVVTVLRRSGYTWPVVYTVAVVVRVPFHLYYGWGALLLGVWAFLIVALYKRTGSALPIAAAHALWDLGATPGFEALQIIKVLCAMGGILVLAINFARIPKRVDSLAHDEDQQ